MGRQLRDDPKAGNNHGYSLVTEGRCGSSRAKIFFVSIISFVIALVIVLLVVVIKVDKRFGGPTEPQENQGCADIAIIGAGVAGSYVAWRLRERNVRIHVYEMADRLGGRLYSTHIPEFKKLNIELGAPHFDPEMQPKVFRLVQQLKLALMRSPHDTNDTVHHLRGVKLARWQLNSSALPYNLLPEESGMTPEELFRKATEKLIDFDDENATSLFHLKDTHGNYIYKQGYMSRLSQVLSSEAVRFLRDTLQRHLYDVNGNAAMFVSTRPHQNKSRDTNLTSTEEMENFTSAATTPGGVTVTTQVYTNVTDQQEKNETLSGLYTLVEGMSDLARTLLTNFQDVSSSFHRVFRNYKLESITPREGIFQLGFRRTETNGSTILDKEGTPSECARKVVLALPPEAIHKLKWEAGENSAVLQEALNGVHHIPATAVIHLFNSSLLYANETVWTKYKTDLLVSELLDLGSFTIYDTNGSELKDFRVISLMARADHAKLLKQRVSENLCADVTETSASGCCTVKDEIIKILRPALTELLGFDIIPRVRRTLTHQWDSDSQGSAWHVWKPCVNWTEVSEKVLKPVSSQDVYIVGSAFAESLKQNTIEGALDSVDRLLNLGYV